VKSIVNITVIILAVLAILLALGFAQNYFSNPTRGCKYIRSFVAQVPSQDTYREYSCGDRTIYIVE
jgi:hypothetical protein